MSPRTINSLPPELHFAILSYLPFSTLIAALRTCKLWNSILSTPSHISSRYLPLSVSKDNVDKYKTGVKIPGLHRLIDSSGCLKIKMTGEELTSLSFLDSSIDSGLRDGQKEEEKWVDIPSSSSLLSDALFSPDAIENIGEEGGFTIYIFHPRLWGSTPWFPTPNVPFSPLGNCKVKDVIQTVKKVFVERYLDDEDKNVYEIRLSHEREDDYGDWLVAGTIERIEVDDPNCASGGEEWNTSPPWNTTVGSGWCDDGDNTAWDS
ncbi:hypothetical protein TWF106_011145 [Orbilia oligospora]|uniref:F-box domain-containing protein n=1 Tax=Orbilia oligospora TaxID=2813651 RepID=A0A6G1MER2_ORBOL|nr:hypothetical protein TWF788_007796 [Orbilia oligospora]KAF3206820.1 hypothetical protein TWF679_008602 [Orbilia oligospora]KAF3208936.1 hypothetical protein TWF106_011145 [Orbilia oligospora]KAF3218547.1 hypothetical protein TWF191_008217 [Orbilia oligospora]KAF3254948.1 hypothetical protein TWF192_003029 [Orbilia oligospora]